MPERAGEGGERGGGCVCVFVFACACPSVREGGYLVSPLAFACACVYHMHVHECMYLPIRACVWYVSVYEA